MTVFSQSLRSVSLSALLLASVAPLSLSLSAHGQDAAVAVSPACDIWSQFAHYTLMARVDLAVKAANALNSSDISNDQLLDGIEASNMRYQDVEKTLADAIKLDGLAKPATALANKIQAARIGRAQDAKRILADIQRLGDGARPYALAVERLKSAGQYSAPLFLSVLTDPNQARLHPHILTAMVEVGDSLAYPLAVSLPYLDAITAERIASLLGSLRHPIALPYLKMAIENKEIRQSTRDVFSKVYTQLATRASLPKEVTASALFTSQAEAIYKAGSSTPANPLKVNTHGVMSDQGLLWQYTAGLSNVTFVSVPNKIYADHLAMQLAEAALSIDSKNADALTIHLCANLRRANRLKGAADASYAPSRQPPFIHLLLAGPIQQQRVLKRALDARDADLALNAIDALGKTLATYKSEDSRQSLVNCLTYGDSRVRFGAALALGNTLPEKEFAGSSTVVSVLSQILRASAEPNALVVATPEGDGNQVGVVTSALEKSGFKHAVGGQTFAQAKTVGASALPSTDILVYQGSLTGFNALMTAIQSASTLRAVPVLALVDAQTAAAIAQDYSNNPRITTGDVSLLQTPDALSKAAKLAITSYSGEPLDAKGVDTYATQALAELYEIASTQCAYDAEDASTTLESALSDERSFVAIGAARVLEKFDTATSQNALLKAALANTGEVQDAQMSAVAKSFKTFGNKANADLFKQLVDLFKTTPSAMIASAIGAGRPSPDLSVDAILPKQ